jgi:adenosylcobinamide-GDP ribazoletransferase
MRYPPVLRGARAAVAFLTRLPAGGFPYTPDDLRWATAWFPLIGLGVGALMLGGWLLAAPLGAGTAAALVVALGVLVTGALHEDGLADTADALGGAADRERALEILKDPRVGAFGTVAIVLSILLRVTLLATVGPLAPVAILLGQCVSRAPPVWQLAILPYVSLPATAKSTAFTRAAGPQAAVATLWPTALLLALLEVDVLEVADAVGVVAVALGAGATTGAWFHRRLGGVTGDLLGATQQVTEIAVLMTLAFLWR